MNSPPNDIRNFVHKKLLRVAASFVPGGSTALTLGSSFFGGGPQRAPIRRAAPLPPQLRNLGLTDARRREITAAGIAAQARGDTKEAAAFLRELGSQGALRPSSVPPVNPVRAHVIQLKPVSKPFFAAPPRPRERIPQVFPVGATMPIHSRIRRAIVGPPQDDPCGPGRFRVRGVCVDPGAALPGGDPLFSSAAEIGQAVMGRYGAGYFPGSMIIDRAICLKGDVVGDDGICYPKRSIRNSDRAHPRGRQPLLTGGEMRAISIANRAAKKFERTQKRLQSMGMIKKPAPRKAAPKLPAHQHQITSGG